MMINITKEGGSIMLPKRYLINLTVTLLVLLPVLLTAQLAETWKLAPEAGALVVGPNPTDVWWANSAGDVETRACLWDDEYVFGADGTFHNVQQDETWLEGWQTATEGCGTPVAPHNDSNAATWVIDEEAGTLTVLGTGAYLGIPKPFNGGELSDPANAPASITYEITLSEDDNVMTLGLDISTGYWTFKLVSPDWEPYVPSGPLAAAPTPTELEADVISVYSDAYTDILGTNFNPNWGQATAYSEVMIEDNATILYAGLNYQGIDLGSHQDVSGKGYLHIDYWTANSTALNVFLISPGTPNVETAYELPVSFETWMSVDIRLNDFAPVDLADIFQFKFDGNGDIYLDNIYFHGVPWVQPDDLVLNGFETAEEIGIGDEAFWQFDYPVESEGIDFITSTLVNSAGLPQDGVGAGQFNYAVEHYYQYGGFASVNHIADDYLDMSGLNYISFQIQNYIPTNIDSSMALRFTLAEASEQPDPTKWSKDSCEFYYSFIEDDYFLDDEAGSGWSEIRIPLIKSSSNTGGQEYNNGFVHTGWAGITGNDQLDLDKIVGFGFEWVSPPWNTVIGDVITGAVWFDNLKAIYSNDIYGCMDPSSLNYNPDATIDDESCLYDTDVVDVTFELNMSMQTVNEEGVHIAGGNYFGPPIPRFKFNDDGIAGDRIAGDDIYTIVVQLLNNFNENYTFSNGADQDFQDKENIAGQSCADGQYNDRRLTVGINDTTITTCFAECSDDGSCTNVDMVDVTFRVDMRDQIVNVAGVFMAGGGLGDDGYVMDDSDGDDVWELDMSIPAGIEFFWKFRNGPTLGGWQGDWEGGDNGIQLGDGGCGANQYNDRSVTLDVDTVLPAYCFGYCYACSPVHDVVVTFSVDMSAESAFNPATDAPYVISSIDEWSFDNIVLFTQSALSGVWDGTLTLSSRDTVNYLFVYGAGTYEDMTGDACAVYDDVATLDVRQLIMPVDETTEFEPGIQIFGSCAYVGVDDKNLALPTEFLVSTFPNPFNPDVTVQYQLPAVEDIKIDVYNMLGQSVKSLVNRRHAGGHYSVVWNGRNENGQAVGTGIYFVVVTRASGTSVSKVTLLK